MNKKDLSERSLVECFAEGQRTRRWLQSIKHRKYHLAGHLRQVLAWLGESHSPSASMASVIAHLRRGRVV